MWSKEEFVDQDSVPKDSGSETRTPFLVKLTRSGPHWNNIGFLLSPDDSPTSLTIDNMWGPSLLSEWNQQQARTRTQVRPGDMIIAVSKQSKAADHMLLMIQQVGRGEDLLLLIDPGPDIFHSDSNQSGPSSVPDPRPGPFVKSHLLFEETSAIAKRPKHPELKGHFATLNISDLSPDDEIRTHYKHLCRLWHPDKNLHNVKQAKEKFQAINTAYNMIKMKLHL